MVSDPEGDFLKFGTGRSMEPVGGDMEPRETSGVTVHAIVRYVADRGGAQAVNRLLERAGRSEDADAFLDKRDPDWSKIPWAY